MCMCCWVFHLVALFWNCFFSSRRRHTRCALVTGVQTCALPIFSRVELVKSRPGFAQNIRPRAGSIIASPVLASYDPDPDYFFHWYRDSAVVIDALRVLCEDGSIGTEEIGRAHV